MNKLARRALCLELRTYALKPAHFGNYIKLSNEKFHLRTQHSKLNGFWIHDLGGLNAVTHLWEYDDLKHRAEVRANLAADPEWIADYVTHLTPMLAQQENAIVEQPHWAENMLNPESGDGHVYLLEELSVSTSTDLEGILAQSDHLRRGRLVNCLVDDIGTDGRVTLIWQFGSLDETRGLRHNYVINQKSIVMLPAPWSPMK